MKRRKQNKKKRRAVTVCLLPCFDVVYIETYNKECTFVLTLIGNSSTAHQICRKHGMVFLSLENTCPRQNWKPGLSSLKCKTKYGNQVKYLKRNKLFISLTQKYESIFIIQVRQTWCAPLMSTEGLSPTIYSVLKWWLPGFAWFTSWASGWRDDTSCFSTVPAFWNTKAFGLPKEVYSRALGWILHILLVALFMSSYDIENLDILCQVNKGMIYGLQISTFYVHSSHLSKKMFQLKCKRFPKTNLSKLHSLSYCPSLGGPQENSSNSLNKLK